MAEAMTAEVLGAQERRNSGTAWTRNDKFEKDGYLVVKDLWDAEDLYHPLPDIKGQLNYWNKDVTKFNHNPVEGQVDGSLARYWHPQYRNAHTGIRRKLEKIIGRTLYNTYYYDRYYFPGQELTKHADRDACETTLVQFLNFSSSLSVLMSPFLPESSQKAWDYLGKDSKIEDLGWNSALDSQDSFELKQPLPLFTKLNMEEILEKEMPPEETNELANVKPEVTFDDFKKLDIRIGTVEKVEEHPNADKLWLLDVNFGGPVKRIVTGLRGIYDHKELLGKKIAVLVNLAPAKFRGEQSNGMLLAAEGEGIVSLLEPDKDIEDGSEVH